MFETNWSKFCLSNLILDFVLVDLENLIESDWKCWSILCKFSDQVQLNFRHDASQASTKVPTGFQKWI